MFSPSLNTWAPTQLRRFYAIRLEAIANSFLSLFILFPFGPFQEAGPRASQHTSPCVHAMVLRC